MVDDLELLELFARFTTRERGAELPVSAAELELIRTFNTTAKRCGAPPAFLLSRRRRLDAVMLAAAARAQHDAPPDETT